MILGTMFATTFSWGSLTFSPYSLCVPAACICVFKCVLGFIHAVTPEFRLEDTRNTILSFHHGSPRNRTQIIKFGGKCRFIHWGVLLSLYYKLSIDSDNEVLDQQLKRKRLFACINSLLFMGEKCVLNTGGSMNPNSVIQRSFMAAFQFNAIFPPLPIQITKISQHSSFLSTFQGFNLQWYNHAR